MAEPTHADLAQAVRDNPGIAVADIVKRFEELRGQGEPAKTTVEDLFRQATAAGEPRPAGPDLSHVSDPRRRADMATVANHRAEVARLAAVHDNNRRM